MFNDGNGNNPFERKPPGQNNFFVTSGGMPAGTQFGNMFVYADGSPAGTQLGNMFVKADGSPAGNQIGNMFIKAAGTPAGTQFGNMVVGADGSPLGNTSVPNQGGGFLALLAKKTLRLGGGIDGGHEYGTREEESRARQGEQEREGGAARPVS